MANSIFLNFSGLTTDGSGNITFPASALFADGVIAAPSIAFASQPALGFFKPASNIIDFSLPNYSATLPAMRFSNFGITLGQQAGYFISKTNGANGTVNGSIQGLLNGTNQFMLSNTAVTVGVGLDFSTNNVLLLRNLAHNAYATLDLLGLKSSGSACPSFGPSAVASITVVNGLITAIS